MGKRTRPDVAEAVAKLRVATPCVHCGGGPVEWHSDRHLTNRNRRVSNLVGHGYKLCDVLHEISQCEPVCRSCHMKHDGRSARLLLASPTGSGVEIPPKPCVACGKESKPLRRGKCNRCRMREKRSGK